MPFFAIFGLVAIIEMATFFWVESRIGLGWALALALATAVIGSALVRRAGISVWRRFRSRLDGGAVPTRELSHGAAILVAGAFLISPGFVTDLLGFTLLVPGIRDFIYQQVTKSFAGRFSMLGGVSRGSGRGNTVPESPGDVIDVEGWEQDGGRSLDP